jgi:membrane protease YdiL (CAAX protease family)
VADVVSGPVTWLAALPLAVLGAVIMVLIIIAMHGRLPMPELMLAQLPTHPIIDLIRKADRWTIIQIFFAACIAAPVVEEVFFRGVFYRHVREATNRWGSGWSILASAVAASFIFAVIHPQGLIAVPVLMGLAIGFSLGREWRGSLVTCIVAHAVSNGLVMLLAVKLLAP